MNIFMTYWMIFININSQNNLLPTDGGLPPQDICNARDFSCVVKTFVAELLSMTFTVSVQSAKTSTMKKYTPVDTEFFAFLFRMTYFLQSIVTYCMLEKDSSIKHSGQARVKKIKTDKYIHDFKVPIDSYDLSLAGRITISSRIGLNLFDVYSMPEFTLPGETYASMSCISTGSSDCNTCSARSQCLNRCSY